MKSKITIAPAGNKDRPAILALLADENLPTTDLSENMDHFFTAKDSDRIIGVIGLEIYGPFGLLRSLAVAKEFRGQRIGSVLTSALETLSKQLSVSELYLLTETAPDFFKKFSYRVVDRKDVPDLIKASSEYSGVCPSTAIVLKKSLS